MTLHDPAQLQAQRLAAVQGSFATIHAQATPLSRNFQSRLREADDALGAIFADSEDLESPRMMDLVNTLVVGMGHLEAAMPIMRNLALRYSRLGVQVAHYDTLGQVLMETLSEALGPSRFNAFVQESWEAGYATMSRIMKHASMGEAQQTARHIAAPADAGLAPAAATSY